MIAGLMQQALFSAPPAATVAAATVTWNSATSSADWQPFTNSNLTAERTSTSTGFWALVRATAAKASGTVVFTVNAVGGNANDYVGFDNGTETVNLGGGAGISIGWAKSGAIVYQASTIATYGAWTTADVLKIVKAGKDVSFYLNNALQGTIDLDFQFGSTSPLTGATAYPASSNGNSTGLKLTIDGSLWV